MESWALSPFCEQASEQQQSSTIFSLRNHHSARLDRRMRDGKKAERLLAALASSVHLVSITRERGKRHREFVRSSPRNGCLFKRCPQTILICRVAQVAISSYRLDSAELGSNRSGHDTLKRCESKRAPNIGGGKGEGIYARHAPINFHNSIFQRSRAAGVLAKRKLTRLVT